MKRLATGICCALLIQSALIVTAEARPRHRAAHQRVHVQPAPEAPSFFESFSGSSGVVQKARKYLGATAAQVGVRRNLWCSAFLRKITGATGVDDRAKSWESKRRIAPQVGAVVTMGRKGGGHVGIVSGFTPKGDPIVISGNGAGSRVVETVYPRSRIRAWVSPS